MSNPPSLPPGAAAQLRALGRRPNRRLSQSFLASQQIAAAMVTAGEVGPEDLVLEIGPGLGILTRELVAAAGRVVSVELDAALAAALPSSLGFPQNLQVAQGDATSIDLKALVSEPYLVVASLPYHVGTPVLFRLAFERPRPQRIVVMLQEEVARRIVAEPGAMTYLAAALGTVATTRLVRRVGPGSFVPVPKVRSAVVRLDLLPEPQVGVDRLDRFIQLLRAGFAQPRQQLHNSLGRGLAVPVSEVRSIVEQIGLPPSRRPAELTLAEWELVYRRVEDLGWLPQKDERRMTSDE